MQIYIYFKQLRHLKLVTWSKGHVWEPLTLCKHLAYCGVDTSSAGGTMRIDVATGGGNCSIQVVFKCWAQFTNCIRKANNSQTDDAK